MVLSLVSKALLLGFSSGLFCTGFCLPLVGPVVLANDSRGKWHAAERIGLFLAGRLAAYLLFGLAFGALGGYLSKVLPARVVLRSTIYVVLGALVIAYGLVRSFPHLGFCRAASPHVASGRYVAVLGFVAGINLCPPFLLAVTTVADMRGALNGALFFLVFFLATSVYLLPLLFSGLVSRFASVRFAARVAAVVSGSYFVFLGLRIALWR